MTWSWGRLPQSRRCSGLSVVLSLWTPSLQPPCIQDSVFTSCQVRETATASFAFCGKDAALKACQGCDEAVKGVERPIGSAEITLLPVSETRTQEKQSLWSQGGALRPGVHLLRRLRETRSERGSPLFRGCDPGTQLRTSHLVLVFSHQVVYDSLPPHGLHRATPHHLPEFVQAHVL